MKLTPIYYDTETTGLRSETDRIIEIAAYDPVKNRSFSQLIHPQVPISPESTALTSITNEMVANAPEFSIVAEQFIQFCGPNAILIAHNNDKFDKLFLEAEIRRANLLLPNWKYVDSLKWARKYRSDLPSHSLQNLREVYGIEANQAHRALNDTMALFKIFSIMIDDLPIDTVYKLLSQPTDKKRMPFGKYQGIPLSEIPKNYLRWLKESGILEQSAQRDLKETIISILSATSS